MIIRGGWDYYSEHIIVVVICFDLRNKHAIIVNKLYILNLPVETVIELVILDTYYSITTITSYLIGISFMNLLYLL